MNEEKQLQLGRLTSRPAVLLWALLDRPRACVPAAIQILPPLSSCSRSRSRSSSPFSHLGLHTHESSGFTTRDNADRTALRRRRRRVALLRRARGTLLARRFPRRLRSLTNHGLLQVLRLQYQKELSQGHVTVQTKFNYAWGLVKSPMREHQAEGVRLLQGTSQ